jgi:hypothetical protein
MLNTQCSTRSHARFGGARTLAICALTFGAMGCWLPIHYREAGSPPLVGNVRRSDGSPAVGTRVAVTSDWRDATCDRAITRGATDSTGLFRLQPTIVERRGILLIPPIERFSTGYYVCVGVPDDSMMRLVYGGSMPITDKLVTTAPEPVACLQWMWDARSHITCARRGETALQAGGGWRDGAGAGYYRVIVGPSGVNTRDQRVFLQWVQHADSGRRDVVRAMIAVPLAPRIIDLSVEELLVHSTGGVCVTVHTTSKPRGISWDVDREQIALELGLPGQTRRLLSCAGEGESAGG